MRYILPVVVIMSLTLSACSSGQHGSIQGAVSPPRADVRVTVKAGATAVATSTPDARTGAFSVSLTAGTYDVSIASSTSPFPISFSGITVEPGRSVSLGVIQLAPVRGTGAIRGRIVGGKTARISLLVDGRERASVTTDPSGKYELKELPAGAYTLKVQAQDYAGDTRSVVLGENQQAAVNVRLLYMTAVDGVDWAQNTIRTRGVGYPPPQAATPTVRREMAKRAALAAAERDLFRVVGLVETGPGENLSKVLGEHSYTQRLAGYLSGFHVAADRDLDGGRVEIEIELPLTGPGGLTSYLPAD